jgi:hypothetical protein
MVEKAREDVNALEHVVKSLGDLVVARELAPLALHPIDEIVDQRRDVFAADGCARFGRQAIDRAFQPKMASNL